MSAGSGETVEEIENSARNLRRWAFFFKCNHLLLIPFWFMSDEPPVQKAMFVYLAGVSIHALVKTYDAEAEAADSKAASFDQ